MIYHDWQREQCATICRLRLCVNLHAWLVMVVGQWLPVRLSHWCMYQFAVDTPPVSSLLIMIKHQQPSTIDQPSPVEPYQPWLAPTCRRVAVEHGDVKAFGLRLLAQHRGWQLTLISHHHLDARLTKPVKARGDQLWCVTLVGMLGQWF